MKPESKFTQDLGSELNFDKDSCEQYPSFFLEREPIAFTCPGNEQNVAQILCGFNLDYLIQNKYNPHNTTNLD